MAKLTFIQLAQKVLSENTVPMSVEEIWNFADEKKYIQDLNSIGKTPKATLGAQLYVSLRSGETSLFCATEDRPKRFYLCSMTDQLNFDDQPQKNSDQKQATIEYLEKDLHPFVAYYANLYLKAYCKTINHLKSGKLKFGGWVHPDMVGCYFPMQDLKPKTIEFSQAIGAMNIRLYSFELKRELSFANLREAFFQAVSNSSWAHEGYLCAADILADEEFRSELKRLSGSFGIGILEIDVEDPNSCKIIFPAKVNDSLDWEAVNKLCTNEDFTEFLDRVRIDLMGKEIRKEKYDPILSAEALQESINAKKA